MKLARLEGRRHDEVDKLSGGMRRRLLLARGLVHQAADLLLDEPTVGLDPQIRTELWSLIDGLRTEGTTILMSTHYIEEAERLADEVAVMAHGKIIARGRPVRADHRARGTRDGGGVWPHRQSSLRHGRRPRAQGLTVRPAGPAHRDRRLRTGDATARFQRRRSRRAASLEDVFVILTGAEAE